MYLPIRLYHDFLRKFKRALREEISYISNKIKLLEDQGSKRVEQKTYKPDIEWNANLNDLIELVRALKISGAINNKSKNIKYNDVYKIFGDLFGIELKNPEDQMREKATVTRTKISFCERLKEIAQEDLGGFSKCSNKK